MHQSFITAYFTSWRQDYKFRLRNPRVLLSLNANIAYMCKFHLKSFLIVTPRYLMLSTFSRIVVSNVYEAWLLDLFPCQLHHIVFDKLKSHTPFPCPGTQSINNPLKFHYVFVILNFMIANTVIGKKSCFRLNICWDVIYVQREQQGPRTVPHGTPNKTGAQLEFVFYVKTDGSPLLEWCSFVQKVRFWYSKGV